MPVGTTRELSLRQRLLLLTMITSGIGVLLGCLCFLAYDMHVAKEHREEDLRSVADLIGTNSTAALAFDDAIGASKILEALSTRNHIRLGVLYRSDGIHFASYVRADLQGNASPPRVGGEVRDVGVDFNHMLDEIERSDSALSEARDVLELRVAARTGELEMEIKERRRAEQELQQRTAFLNTLITNNPLAIAVGGPDGNLELVNPAFEKLFGYTSQEAIGSRVDALLYPSSLSREQMDERLKNVKKGFIHETAKRRKKSGDLVDVELHAVPLALESGEQNVLALYQDISGRLEAQRALRESEELFRPLSAAAPIAIFSSH